MFTMMESEVFFQSLDCCHSLFKTEKSIEYFLSYETYLQKVYLAATINTTKLLILLSLTKV